MEPRRAVVDDVLKLSIKVENNIIVDAKWRTYGCGAAIASSSIVSEIAKGLTLEEAGEIKNSQIASELSLPP